MKDVKERMIEEILEIVGIDSVTDNLSGITKCQDAIADIALDMGYSVQWHGKNKVLVIQPYIYENILPKEQADLGIVVHLDTVPYDLAEWQHNPLGEVADGRIYGRGVVDDKAAIILSLHAFKELEKAISPSWQLIIGSSEEAEWTDMEEFLKESPLLPRFMVTVDGDGVQNACRGYMDLELHFNCEDPSNDLFIQEIQIPGQSNNTVPGKACAFLSNEVIYETTGKAAHSSAPENGVNALFSLANLLYGEMMDSYPDFFELMDLLKGKLPANSLGFAEETDVCPTNLSVADGTLTVNLNIRLGYSENRQHVLDVIKSIEKRFHCKAEIKEITMPAYVPANSEEIQNMCYAYEAILGKPIKPTQARGVGYNAALPNCAIFGPRFAPEDDEEDLCHCADENRRIADLMSLYDMLKIFISLTCS